MNFVNKEYGFPLALPQLLEYRFKPILKLATVFGAGYQGPQIQGNHLFVAQGIRHVAIDDALGQALDDGGFAHPRFTDQHRVIFGPPGENLNHSPNLIIAANHRVELALTGHIGKIKGVFFQGLIFALRIGVGNPLAAPHRHQSLQKNLAINPILDQGLSGGNVPVVKQGQNQVLLADIFILHLSRHLEGPVQQTLQRWRGINLAIATATDLGQTAKQDIDLGDKLFPTDPHFLQNRGNYPVSLRQQAFEQMLRLYFLVLQTHSQALSFLHRFLRFHRQLVEFHDYLLPTGKIATNPVSSG